jgi:prepilin signal peptidase PulO-like enzyme (type II secretory pathway)
MAFPRSISTPARHGAVLENAPYIAALVAAAGIALLTITVPREIVLPALSIILLVLAFGLAGVARLRRGHSQASSCWYLSAALTFIGFGAAFLTDAEHVLPLFEGTRRSP